MRRSPSSRDCRQVFVDIQLEVCRFHNSNFYSLIAPTLIHKSYPYLSLSRFMINKKILQRRMNPRFLVRASATGVGLVSTGLPSRLNRVIVHRIRGLLVCWPRLFLWGFLDKFVLSCNPVYTRHVDSSTLVFSLSSHLPSFISLLFSSRFLDS